MDGKIAVRNIFLESLIDFFNDLAFIVQFKHKQYISSCLFATFLFYDWPFLPVCILQGSLLFSALILGSLFSEYVVFYRVNTLVVQLEQSRPQCTCVAGQ